MENGSDDAVVIFVGKGSPLVEYDSPEEAILAGTAQNLHLDPRLELIKGETIASLDWGAAWLDFQFSRHTLSLTVDRDRIRYSVEDLNASERTPSPTKNKDVLLQFQNSETGNWSEYRWSRVVIANALALGTFKMLHLSDNWVFVYVNQVILLVMVRVDTAGNRYISWNYAD